MHGAPVAAEANLGALSPPRPTSSTWCNHPTFSLHYTFYTDAQLRVLRTLSLSHTFCEFNPHFAALSMRSSRQWVVGVLQYTRCPNGQFSLLEATLIMHDPFSQFGR